MSEYEGLFRAEGYETSEDIENLKGLTEKELRGIGIIKRGKLVGLSSVNWSVSRQVSQHRHRAVK